MAARKKSGNKRAAQSIFNKAGRDWRHEESRRQQFRGLYGNEGTKINIANPGVTKPPKGSTIKKKKKR